MHIHEKLKLNRFQSVNIPSNRSYFQRFGLTSPSSGQTTGDDLVPMPRNKVDTFADMEEYDKLRQQEEANKPE